MARALVIGAGPAGLMAADILSAAGHDVTIADAMPSPARKFLMAGKSGLNITKVGEGFFDAYGNIPDVMRRALEGFGPQDVIDWAEALGQTTFIGSTGRVFPEVMKASPLLRAWLARLAAQGAVMRLRWRWTGWDGAQALFDTPEGVARVDADVTVLALGGASWSRLGSDGQWTSLMPVPVAPFKPANMGFIVDWTPHMASHYGQPVKGCALIAGDRVSRGEFVVSSRGIEGGGIYAIAADVRDGATLRIDLAPDMSVDELRTRLARKGKASLANFLRKSLKWDAVKNALLNEFGRPFPDDIASLVKSLPVTHAGPRPMDEAISVAGGVPFAALDDGLMIGARPGVFCAGEMLDWEAPTGGYLITGCLATGRWAALAALSYAARAAEGRA